ncbi:hypothetical protein Micbo1qcDRAFT_181829 [Microdochium bolleyi]|uniref:FAD-binding PCMH-type domain-containing protein n=1 Tax=Microdochium bolleyi TaxID=196109 RepID=A0A136JJK0_9PEZI|nr:hypothetical protein Micbo1qcDRAFT_181829 [Microdochium bolleyi]
MKFSLQSVTLWAVLPLGVIADEAFVAGGAGTCCKGLKLLLGDKVSTEGDPAYSSSLESYYSNLNVEITPSCIVTPTTKEHVALSVFVLNIGSKLLPGRCNFAVRSGGHSTVPGANNIQDGVTIDMSKLNHVTVSKDRKTVEVGAGNRWVNVYSQLDPQGLTVVGGRVDTVGVSGLITGGGISYFSPRYGYAVDSVDNFEIVLASGRIVNANSRDNADLWKALKGGSGNFGIVTSFRLRAYQQGLLWGGQVTLDVATIDKQCAIFESLTGSQDYDPYASWMFSLAYMQDSKSWIAGHNLVYTRPEANPAVFKPLLDLPQTYNTAAVKNLTTLTLELGYPNPFGRRQSMSTATFRNSAALMREITKIGMAKFAGVANVPNVSYSVTFQPLPVVINSKAASTGGNSLGLDASDGPLVNLVLNFAWDDKSADASIRATEKAFFAEVNAKAKAMGRSHAYQYLNYAAAWQDPIAGYGPDVKKTLQAASRKYDPTGLFQRNAPGGFKLF